MYLHERFGVENLIETGYLECIKQRKLITKENVDCRYYEDRTALHIAIISNQVQIVKWLLEQFKPNLQLEDSLSLTPMHWLHIKAHYHHSTIFIPLYEKISSLLLETTNKTFQKHQQYNFKQQSIFFNIINHKNLNICLAAQLTIQILSQQFNNNNLNDKNKKKNIYLKTNFNRKAHHWAAISGNVQSFSVLMKHKFDPYQQDAFGFNCYHYIAVNKNNPINQFVHWDKNQIHKHQIKNNLTCHPKLNHYDTIIIGAGAAGIGAAITLSRAGLPYIILQARQRIGGRIYSKQVNSIEMDLGACWVHSYSKYNPIFKQAKKLNWKTKQLPAFTDSLILSQLYLNKQLPQKDIQHAMILSQTYFSHVQQRVFLSKDDLSIEQAGRQFYQSSIATLNPTKKSLVDMFINMTEHYNAAEVQKLSAKYFDEQEDIGGDWLPQGGYGKLMSAIAESIQLEKKVIFGAQVKQIFYKSQQQSNQQQYCQIITTQGQKYYGKCIISSLPLGILKSHRVKFSPPLSEQLQNSIQKMGYGVMNKVIVSFQSPFWKHNPTWLRIACEERGKFPATFNFSTQDKHILCFFITDKFARKMSPQTDQQILTSLLQLLKKVTHSKQQIKIVDYTITRWDQDPYSLGSYSYFGVGTDIQTTKKLRRAIDGKLWMVGEHCYGEHIGCAHGAFQTGIWAAEQILTQIKTVNTIKKQ